MSIPSAIFIHRADSTPLETAFWSAALDDHDPLGHFRRVAWQDAARGLSAGRVEMSGTVESDAYPYTETLIVLSGALTVTAEGGKPLALTPGLGAVIGAGSAVRLEAAEGTALAFCTIAGVLTPQRVVVPLVPEARFEPSASPPPEILLGPAPSCRNENVYRDPAARYRAGTWDSTPYRRIIRAHRMHELMHLLEGNGRFERPDGSELRAGAGDTVFVPHGTEIGWDSPNKVAKYFVIQEVT